MCVCHIPEGANDEVTEGVQITCSSRYQTGCMTTFQHAMTSHRLLKMSDANEIVKTFVC